MIPGGRWAAALGLAVLMGACGGAAGTARAALDAAERSLGEVAPAAEPVVPEFVKEARHAIASAREMLEQGDADGALRRANSATAKVAELPQQAEEARTRLTDEWSRMQPAMVANLDSVGARVDRFSRGRLPAGVTREGVEAARETVNAAKVTWPEIEAEQKAGNLAAAMDRAMALRVKVSEAMTALGMAADDRAWGNLQLRPARTQ